MPANRHADGRCKRGSSNTNDRGSAHERRRRKCWIRPSCQSCNIRTGNAVKALIRKGVARRTILRMCRTGEL